MAEVGEGSLDLLVPPALCHFSLGKADRKLEIAESSGFREDSLTWDLGPGTCDLGLKKEGRYVCNPSFSDGGSLWVCLADNHPGLGPNRSFEKKFDLAGTPRVGRGF